ncbi:hypothetical protein H696_02062 [Fonticula alba]|uniref:Uncharacterized protein n=1 Tax=Fonticula alba TaxID=691883 RepID=A0A058ZAZ8_FONAL|nr:hypothetical protein H696_02062 [Fonticula alba]KCV71111.1 hypothetical protein H696_02062 [Fonticula alba]|eukprot:XP_009494234.1 hypothetical protein H696_02062 [Fonticula alba]
MSQIHLPSLYQAARLGFGIAIPHYLVVPAIRLASFPYYLQREGWKPRDAERFVGLTAPEAEAATAAKTAALAADPFANHPFSRHLGPDAAENAARQQILEMQRNAEADTRLAQAARDARAAILPARHRLVMEFAKDLPPWPPATRNQRELVPRVAWLRRGYSGDIMDYLNLARRLEETGDQEAMAAYQAFVQEGTHALDNLALRNPLLRELLPRPDDFDLCILLDTIPEQVAQMYGHSPMARVGIPVQSFSELNTDEIMDIIDEEMDFGEDPNDPRGPMASPRPIDRTDGRFFTEYRNLYEALTGTGAGAMPADNVRGRRRRSNTPPTLPDAMIMPGHFVYAPLARETGLYFAGHATGSATYDSDLIDDDDAQLMRELQDTAAAITSAAQGPSNLDNLLQSLNQEQPDGERVSGRAQAFRPGQSVNRDALRQAERLAAEARERAIHAEEVLAAARLGPANERATAAAAAAAAAEQVRLADRTVAAARQARQASHVKTTVVAEALEDAVEDVSHSLSQEAREGREVSPAREAGRPGRRK